jgi:hypothetical protein
MGIQGVFLKRKLPRLDAKDTRWSEWEQQYPSSRLMK